LASHIMKDALLAYVKQVKARYEKVRGNESATKGSLIAPLFTLLGYDLADPLECVPEFKADFGKTRGKEPVDWAFFQNGQPIFLVEAKDAGTKLGGYDEQLGDYFAKQPEAKLKLGILTNGVAWRFFTDLIHPNIMDKEPFVIWDVLSDDQPPFDFLRLLQKLQFKTELVRTFAQRQHDLNFLVNELDKLLEPSDEFTRLAIANREGRNPMPNVVESWKSLVARAIGEWAKQRRLADVLNPSPGIKTAGHVPRTEEGTNQGVGGSKLADLIAAGILKAPLKLSRKYKGQLVEAELLADGSIVIHGTTYATCSAAAEAARKSVTGQTMTTNGWTFWQYRDVNGKRLCLDDARKACIKAKHGQDGPVVPGEQPKRYRLRKKFWAGLVSRPKVNARHANIAASEYSWIAAGSGVRGCPFTYSIGQNEGRVELYIDRGAGKKDENKRMFDWLQKHQNEIEQAFGGKLVWQRLDDKQGCRIAYTTTVGGWRSDELKWPGIQDAMIDAMIRLENALTPHLPKLNTEFA
jgi:Domain of unknown function (DUF4268)/Restriction Enzyme Adenine Methylase Associated/Type I restriction enzyme R protein N terminus (HSDR_N)